MINNEKLQINLLGGSSLIYKDKIINDRNIRSKKFWQILEYLITFRNRDISQTELLDLIYPGGKSENPVNALKTLMHRIRGELDQLEFMDSRKMIIHSRGAYAWNTKMDFEIDVDVFEALCDKGHSRSANEEERLGYLLQAIEIYNGDFLHKSSLEPWAMQYNIYYRTMYGKAVHTAIEILKNRGEHSKIVEICEKALGIDAFDEFLYYNLILGLVKVNNYQAALVEYRKMTALFFNEFGVNPSSEITKLYREIIKTSKKVETDLNVIRDSLKEELQSEGAFLCEYEIFKDIYRLELRSKPRTGETVCLGLLTVTDEKNNLPPLKTLTAYMEKLQSCVKKTLRENDVFARYSVSQFILMLPLTTFENADKALKRVVKAFHRQYPYCNLEVHSALLPLESRLKI